jgi:uncharacterized protein
VNVVLRNSGYREGPWRNGLGVSWDIAQEGGGEAFDWRLALAKIDADVPFSHYPDVDRVFTLIAGEGLTLDIEGRGAIGIAKYRPVNFPGDRPTACRLKAGPCRALNLFLKRGAFAADVAVTSHAKGDEISLPAETLVFVAEGLAGVDGEVIAHEDTLLADAPVALRCLADTIMWRATLSRNTSAS